MIVGLMENHSVVAAKNFVVLNKIIKPTYLKIDIEGSLFYASSKDASEGKLDMWYLDNGCSNHMTKDESILCSPDKTKAKIKI